MQKFLTIAKKPQLKIVDNRETTERKKFIKVEMEIQYTDDLWDFFGKTGGDPLNATLQLAQGEIFGE